MIYPAKRQRAHLRPPETPARPEPVYAVGELLTMPDGSEWFHAFSGAAPVKITPDNRSGLIVEG